MSFKRFIARTFQRFSRWTIDVDTLPPKAVVIGAPHTSNWDALYMLMAFWHADRNLRFLIKSSYMRQPVGSFIRAVGGVGVDRNSSHGMVHNIVEHAQSVEHFALCVAPKGTRGYRDTWKSGFYYIALEAGIPVVFGFVDSATKTYGWRGSMMLTGDVAADMEKIREFYADKVGIHPELTSVPRLRAEIEEGEISQ
ncbi:1-acyl-sn-glycerol-3-phosphate acyltransferase [Arcanobacterium phocae]|uniref:1-acyl-sn-glycerol-3-phosphate acyltransferase n=1 Tax=Arcanobacterium phocae TaxID=131112 RepID=UPI001C0F2329|nr:1-acyl-sn-glycerol-3-phosphate acyltransferase [Arcanobacterium phocae]